MISEKVKYYDIIISILDNRKIQSKKSIKQEVKKL